MSTPPDPRATGLACVVLRNRPDLLNALVQLLRCPGEERWYITLKLRTEDGEVLDRVLSRLDDIHTEGLQARIHARTDTGQIVEGVLSLADGELDEAIGKAVIRFSHS